LIVPSRHLGLRASWPHARSQHAMMSLSVHRGLLIANGTALLWAKVVLFSYWKSLSIARARGAHIYGELAGYGASADAYHITAPAPDGNGARHAMQRALDRARLDPQDIGYVNAHGTATELGDVAESQAIKEVFWPTCPLCLVHKIDDRALTRRRRGD